MACLQCTSVIDENEQYYATDDMGPEIISVIERYLGHLVDGNEVMCSQCFGIIMQERRAHSIPEGAERQYIAETIAPREIPEGGLICFACWVHTRRTIQQQGIIAAPAVMNMNACVWCRRSLAQTRSHSIPEGPERTIITQTIYPREIPPGGLVCYACWVAARRNVEHATRVEDNRQGPSNLHQDSMCAWCRMSLHRRRTHVASGPVRDEVAARIYPNELPEHALLCSNCWTRAHENIEMEQEVVQFDIQPPSASITLDGFTHTTQTSTHCFVPACNNVERNRVPEYLRRIILKSEKIFVTENARVCNEHKCLYNWEFLDQHQFSNTFTKNEIESMLKLSIQDNEINQLDFNNMSSIDEGLFKFWTGITKDNFINILNVISPALTCKNQKIALGIYLVKARTGDSHERIASLFHLTKSSITRLLRVAKEALLRYFSNGPRDTSKRNYYSALRHIFKSKVILRSRFLGIGFQREISKFEEMC
ncbi:unnamed protein product [Parnassius apollo]|uniref:(apollo) hypothetical protein n=1 Tax=Parnassius apollo TaxID=110799 RepID=A0A8S3Y0B4_PARAO|nr:unnamed protein product [Parnassius apollo]